MSENAAVKCPLYRPARPLLERLRDVERDGMTFAGEAANEIEALRKAIEEWQVTALAERRRGEIAERERCAKLCEDFAHELDARSKLDGQRGAALREAALLMRA